MFPSQFEYVRANSVEEVVGILGEDEDAKIIAGGHSLLPLMKLRLATPSTLVDIGRLSELSFVEDRGDYIAIGALTRHRDIETSRLLADHVPLLGHVAGQVGDPQVRHRGTIGGSIAHGDGASDLPAAILALEATLVINGARGQRTVAATDFFKGFLETDLAQGEVLSEIRVPKSPGGWSFQKFNRRAQDWAIVGVALVKGATTRISLINMGPTPLRAYASEEAVNAGASIEEASALASEGISPPSDINASAEYRRHLASVLLRRALQEASA